MIGCISENVPGSHVVNACCTTQVCGSKTLADGSTQTLYWLQGDIWFYTGGYIPRPGENHRPVWDCVCTN
ncbi:hypothetical protein [Paenibacillus assamensis]|uniref:hypothetical protein n=1 Tax=Paenibacillus assamensis TaxID=311244 RepID=UPI00048F7B48|nr:hypothetical protein [Paenibacillus assamensis]